MSLIALIPLPLAFQKWRRKHHKNLELTLSETPPTGQTQGQSVTSAIPDLIEVVVKNLYGERSRQRELLPSRQ